MTVSVKDEDGKEHLCVKVGISKTVEVIPKKSIRETVIDAVRMASGDYDVRYSTSEVAKVNGTGNIYYVKTNYYTYFAKVLNSTTIKVKVNFDNLGFGWYDVNVNVKQFGKYTTFYFKNKCTYIIEGPVYYINWEE